VSPGSFEESARRAEQLRLVQRAASEGKALHLLLGSLDYEATLATVAGLALPEVGAWSIVDLCQPSGEMRRLAVVHPDPDMRDLAEALQVGWPPQTGDPIGAPVALRTGSTQVVSQVSDEMLVQVARDEGNLAVLRRLGLGSFMVVPLTVRGRILGAITFVQPTAGHRYTEQDRAFAEELAALSALAIDRAMLHREAQEARGEADDRARVAERQQQELERIMEIQARLVRGFSHDVKNPLGAAQGYAELLETGVLGSLDARQVQSVARIRASIHSALALIDDLVEYAKSRMGKVDIQPEPTDVAEVVLELIEEYRAQIESAGLELEVEIPSDVPVIHSDRLRIRQILGNLLSNAVKYTTAGRVAVRVALHDGDETPWGGEGWISIEVEDTGRGIPRDQQHLIFHEFARLEPTTTQGAGLGLAISQWVADALHARITLESDRDQGSTFTLWLPLVTPSEEAAATERG